MEKLVVGMIGAGRIGIVHTEALLAIPEVKIKVNADLRADELVDYSKKYNIPLIKDYHEILNDPEIDIVYICSSTDSHTQIIKDAANAKKHIFCEKPISKSDKETLEAFNAVKENNVKFFLGFNRRFDRNFLMTKKYVEEQRAGDLQIIRIDSRDPEAPSRSYVETSGGMFFDMMIHDFDMARYISGSEVEEVYAIGEALVDPDISDIDVDTAIVTLKFKNGAIGVITNSRQAVYGYDQRIEVFGSKGSISTENELESQVKISDVDGVHSEKPLWFFLQRYKDAYRKESEVFIEAILNDTEIPVGFEDGIIAQRIAFAAEESLKAKIPIKIELI